MLSTQVLFGSHLVTRPVSLRFRCSALPSPLQTRKLATMPADMAARPPSLLFRQLFEKESSTFTYLLADLNHPDKPAVLVDPVDRTVDRDVNLVRELGLKLIYVVNTHVHADHVTGTGLLKVKIPGAKSVISKASAAKADVQVLPGDKVQFGNLFLEVRPTPGHTQGCVTYVTGEGPDQVYPRLAFTGDALLIRGCGRTDFQGGDSARLYDSVHSQIFSLPPETFLYPAHDYKGQTVTTVGEEKLHNPRLSKDLVCFAGNVQDNHDKSQFGLPKDDGRSSAFEFEVWLPRRLVDGKSYTELLTLRGGTSALRVTRAQDRPILHYLFLPEERFTTAFFEQS